MIAPQTYQWVKSSLYRVLRIGDRKHDFHECNNLPSFASFPSPCQGSHFHPLWSRLQHLDQFLNCTTRTPIIISTPNTMCKRSIIIESNNIFQCTFYYFKILVLKGMDAFHSSATRLQMSVSNKDWVIWNLKLFHNQNLHHLPLPS